MRQTITILAFLAAVAMASFAVSNQPNPQQAGQGVLGILAPGQPVTVKETAGGYEIGVFRGGPEELGYRVLEVGQDYLVVEDITGVTELRIPIWSIQAVRVMKLAVR